MAAHDFLENELKITIATIISSKLSTTSPILWIEVQSEEIALNIQKQSAILKREERAIMYPPPEFFRTIQSIENKCKEAKKKNTDLRYMVKLGHDNIELWTKQLRKPQYTQESLTVFGEIEEPNIEHIITTPNFGQSPPKGREKPPSLNTQQHQTTPQRITNEAENEATSNHNIFQRIINDAESETTSNHNIFQGLINEAERETTTNLNLNLNIKQHQATLKRLMGNNKSEATSPKRPNRNNETTDKAMIIDDIALSPGWNKKFLSTVTSPIKENHLDKIKQIINQKIKPTTPTRRR